MVSVPLTKSPAARWVNDAVELDPVLTFAVTETAFSVAGIEGVASGSASGKLIALCPNDNDALALTVAFTVRGFPSDAAKAPPAISTKPKPIANTKLTFFIFPSSFSFFDFPQIWEMREIQFINLAHVQAEFLPDQIQPYTPFPIFSRLIAAFSPYIAKSMPN